MPQRTFADPGFDQYSKKTRKEVFPDEMGAIIPWQELSEVIEPYDPRPQGAAQTKANTTGDVRLKSGKTR